MAVERTILNRLRGESPQVARQGPDIYNVAEPVKVGPDGYVTPEWSHWEMLQAEGRLVRANNGGVIPPSPALDPVLADLDDRIAQAQSRAQAIARTKVATAARLDATRDDRTRARLEDDLQRIGEEELRVRDAEGLLLVERTETASGRRRAIVQ